MKLFQFFFSIFKKKYDDIILVTYLKKIGLVDYNNFVKYVQKRRYKKGIIITEEKTEKNILFHLDSEIVDIIEGVPLQETVQELRKQDKKIEQIAVEDFSDRSIFYDAC